MSDQAVAIIWWDSQDVVHVAWTDPPAIHPAARSIRARHSYVDAVVSGAYLADSLFYVRRPPDKPICIDCLLALFD